jgi:HTH-type transcriptional regulator, sugar sensing transcriptional regulator
MGDAIESIAERLTRLGFSQYEARTYLGLLQGDGTTGYTVANETGVPQPKVYETLRRLVARGAAIQTARRPARYAAVAPDVVLAALEEDFRSRLDAARRGLERLPRKGVHESPVSVSGIDGFETAAEKAVAAIAAAKHRIYISARGDDLKLLAEAVTAASERGVDFVMLHFGRLPFKHPRGQVLRHASTEGALYASRKARHLAIVVDSRWAMWALARDGQQWEGLAGEVPLLASLVKSYIRHDVFVQRIYADLPAQLEERYGRGLLRLADFSADSDEPEGDGLVEAR